MRRLYRNIDTDTIDLGGKLTLLLMMGSLLSSECFQKIEILIKFEPKKKFWEPLGIDVVVIDNSHHF